MLACCPSGHPRFLPPLPGPPSLSGQHPPSLWDSPCVPISSQGSRPGIWQCRLALHMGCGVGVSGRLRHTWGWGKVQETGSCPTRSPRTGHTCMLWPESLPIPSLMAAALESRGLKFSLQTPRLGA